MEEGIQPSSLNRLPHQHATETLLLYFPLLNDLCDQCLVLGQIVLQACSNFEYNMIESLSQTIQNHIQTIYNMSLNVIHTSKPCTYILFPNNNSIINLDDVHTSLINHHSSIWQILKFPGSSKFRSSILEILLHLEQIIYLIFPPTSHHLIENSQHFNYPVKPIAPSYKTQLIQPPEPSLIIDPILRSLENNFYYPLTQTMVLDDMDDAKTNETPTASQVLPKTKNNEITEVETSIETISDVLFEMEGDEPPTQTQFVTALKTAKQQAVQVQATFHKHRFSIYRRSFTNAAQNNPKNQINLFKSFCKCIKKIDNQAQVLPIRNDRKMQVPISHAKQPYGHFYYTMSRKLDTPFQSYLCPRKIVMTYRAQPLMQSFQNYM
jgi:hypothetical protein